MGVDNLQMKSDFRETRRGTTVAFSGGMTGQRDAPSLGRGIARWIRRHVTRDGRALQQRLNRIADETWAADAGTAVRQPRLAINRTNGRLSHRVGVLVLTVAAVVTLGIGGVNAAADSGPSSLAPLTQGPSGSHALLEGLRAVGEGALTVADNKEAIGARHDLNNANRWRRSSTVPTGQRWPLRADPRRWPRLFANTTECTLSLDPITRRHWWR